MATMEATHTVEGLLAVEVAPRAFVVESGQILTRTSATKCGGWEGLEIGEYSGSGTVEVSDEQLAAAERVSALEVASIAESAEESAGPAHVDGMCRHPWRVPDLGRGGIRLLHHRRVESEDRRLVGPVEHPDHIVVRRD